MNPLGIALLLIAFVLGGVKFRLSISVNWHWGLAIFLALIPVVATFFLGMMGLLGSALFVGGLYKATAN